MAKTTLATKLGLKPGQRMALLNAPDGFRERLRFRPEADVTEK